MEESRAKNFSQKLPLGTSSLLLLLWTHGCTCSDCWLTGPPWESTPGRDVCLATLFARGRGSVVVTTHNDGGAKLQGAIYTLNQWPGGDAKFNRENTRVWKTRGRSTYRRFQTHLGNLYFLLLHLESPRAWMSWFPQRGQLHHAHSKSTTKFKAPAAPLSFEAASANRAVNTRRSWHSGGSN